MVFSKLPYSFEGGGVTLPEYASREGCGVKVQESRNATSRQFGRLGGDQKSQKYKCKLALLPLPGDPLFGGAHADPFGV